MSGQQWVWSSGGDTAYEDLPPDMMADDLDVRECFDLHGTLFCTRRHGHSGRHAAGDGERIVAVWP